MGLVIQGRESRQGFTKAALALVLVHLLAAAFLAFAQLPAAGHEVIRDGLILVLPCLTLPFAVRGKQLLPRLILAISLFGIAGQVLWIIQRHGFGDGSEPSWATVPWTVAYSLVVLVVSKWPSRDNGQATVRSLLDGLMVAASIFALAWVFLLAPRLSRAEPPSLKFALDVFYVCIDAAAVVAFLQAIARGIDPRVKSSTRFGVIAIFLIALCDASHFTNHSSTLITEAANLAWPLGVTLANLAAACMTMEMQVPAAPDWEPRVRGGIRASLPCLAIVPVIGLLIYVSSNARLNSFEFGVKMAAILLTLALGVRQYFALADNERLLADLRLTQTELEQKNEEIVKTNDDLTDVLGRLTEKNRELALANEQLARLVTVDGMTGLGNHRAFHERLRLEVEAARKFHHPLSVVLADIDHFRRYNDEYGHPAGDEVLRQIAKTLFDEIDLKAYPARYGGEEFALVLPYVGQAEAVEIARNIGRSVASRLRLKRPITLSFGVASIDGNHWSAELVIEEAFRALDAAKSRGRNQIVLADDLDRRVLLLANDSETRHSFDPAEPMGLAAILSAGLRSHPQALSIEPDIQLVSGLLGTLELKDLETRDHSERVMWYALRLAQSVIETRTARMTQQDIRSLAYGALLHDIGKIGVPEQILKHPGRLDPEMRRVINEHPRHGAMLVQKFPSLELALPVVRHHHERWDGTGYPSGMRSKEIPLVARIFAVVDSLEALTSQRPYKDPLPIEDVTATLVRDSGTHFDPALIEAFLAVPMTEWTRLREMERDVAARASLRESMPLPPV